MQVTKEYDRHFYEVQQQGENGKWYRLVSSDPIEDGSDEKEMVRSVLEEARKQISWTRGLEGFLPSDLLRIGPLRLVRVVRNNKVFGFFDVKKALRATRISSKA